MKMSELIPQVGQRLYDRITQLQHLPPKGLCSTKWQGAHVGGTTGEGGPFTQHQLGICSLPGWSLSYPA